jgi:carbonic anhydrase
MEHVSHLLGGDHVVDRWHNNKHPEKGGSVRQVVDTCHLGRSQPIVDLSHFRDSQRRSTRVQHSNSRSRELQVVIKESTHC